MPDAADDRHAPEGTSADPTAAERRIIDSPLEQGQDAALMVLVAARMVAARVVADLADAGFADARESDGYVFQRLQLGPTPVTELARHLGITQQGASKAVADLERRGYVQRRPSPGDARVREVALTDRGWAVIGAARRSRAAIGELVDERLGVRNAAGFRRSLVAVAEELGAGPALAARNLPAPD